MYKELELLGFFEWLAETHNLGDTDMKPEYLDKLPLNDIHLTVCNSMAFRWFREKYDLIVIIDITYINGRKWRYRIETPPRNFYGFESLKDGFDTHEEAELACLKKLIEIVKGG